MTPFPLFFATIVNSSNVGNVPGLSMKDKMLLNAVLRNVVHGIIYVVLNLLLVNIITKKSRLHNESWFCPRCTSFPFSSLNQLEFAETVITDHDLKQYFNSFPDRHLYKTRCSVCSKKVNSNQQPKSLLCTGCCSFTHRKCSNISTHSLLTSKASHLKNWFCNTCMCSRHPFQMVDNLELLKMSFNSQTHCPCQNNSSDTIPDFPDEYSTTSNLYNTDSLFTHGPDPFNNIDHSLDINAKCNYYTNHDFHKLAVNINKNKTPFSILHTNIQSLSHNFDSLEKLCTDLNYPFDIIALSETWNPENGKDKFIPKQLEGYNKYKGLT